jgi:hypothetical protein
MMAPTVTEACQFHVLLNWILGQEYRPETPVTDDQARDSAAFLADRASKTLSAGRNGSDVVRDWNTKNPAIINVPRLPKRKGKPCP